MSRYRVAVRTLCDFTARQGDLDHRFTPAPSAQEGIEGHALVAKRREKIPGYLAELPLSGEYQRAARIWPRRWFRCGGQLCRRGQDPSR